MNQGFKVHPDSCSITVVIMLPATFIDSPRQVFVENDLILVIEIEQVLDCNGCHSSVTEA